MEHIYKYPRTPHIEDSRIQPGDELTSFLGRSHFKSPACQEHFRRQCQRQDIPYDIALRQTHGSDFMEGIYIKAENQDRVTERLKYVRKSFLTTIMDSETHWVNRPILPNELADGKDLFI